MHTIQFKANEEKATCVIRATEAGLQTLKELIDMKIKMKNHSHETLVCKDYKGMEFKLRFELTEL